MSAFRLKPQKAALFDDGGGNDPVAVASFYASSALSWTLTLTMIVICGFAIYYAITAQQDNTHQNTRMKNIEDKSIYDAFLAANVNATLFAMLTAVNSTLSAKLQLILTTLNVTY